MLTRNRAELKRENDFGICVKVTSLGGADLSKKIIFKEKSVLTPRMIADN